MIAKLALGTAQLGSAYGINNAEGELTAEEAGKVLESACRAGIDLVDTAEGYGSAEVVIGDYRRNNGDMFKVSTKLPGSFNTNGSDMPSRLRKRIQASANKLFAPKMYIYYLHSFGLCTNKKLLYALAEEKAAGAFQHLGVSIYEPAELRYILEGNADCIDAVQIPLNVFNCSQWLEDDLIEEAEARGIILLARSVYLQGAVFMNSDDLRAKALNLSNVLAEYERIVRYCGVSRVELASSFVSHCPGIRYVILGAETPMQVEQNASLIQSGKIDEMAFSTIVDMSRHVKQHLIDPRKWRL